jgi:hypothetical protein
MYSIESLGQLRILSQVKKFKQLQCQHPRCLVGKLQSRIYRLKQRDM